jgi:hypothetical protein
VPLIGRGVSILVGFDAHRSALERHVNAHSDRRIGKLPVERSPPDQGYGAASGITKRTILMHERTDGR